MGGMRVTAAAGPSSDRPCLARYGRAKVAISLARDNSTKDKRHNLARDDAQLDMDRELRGRL
jgi:tmRNA-binding protein